MIPGVNLNEILAGVEPTLLGKVPLTKGSYSIYSPLSLPPGVRLVGDSQSSTVIRITVGPGEYGLTFAGNNTNDNRLGGGLENVTLLVTAGNGLRLYETRRVKIKDCVIDGGTSKSRVAGVGLLIDGGSLGATHNTVEDCFIVGCRDAALRMDTSINRASFSNRNTVRGVYVFGSGCGVDLERADTNTIQVSVGDCKTGVRFGRSARVNFLDVVEEGSRDYSLEFHPFASRNRIMGSYAAAKVRGKGSRTLWVSSTPQPFMEVVE